MILVPLTGVAWVLVVASVAWACVTFQGRFHVETSNGTSTAFGSGYHPDSGGQADIEYCRPPSGSAQADDATATTVHLTMAPYGGCQWVNPDNTESKTDGGPVSGGVYEVRLDRRPVFCDLSEPDCPPTGQSTPEQWNKQAGWFRISLTQDGQPAEPGSEDPEHARGAQCFFPSDRDTFKQLRDQGHIVELEPMTVDESGRGSATVTIPPGPATGPNDAAGICTREIKEANDHPGPPHSAMAQVIVM